MAKISSIAKNERRKKLANKLEPLRRELRKIVVDSKKTWEEREAAQIKLQGLPRNGNLNRVRNRCILTGRSRGNYTKFGLSRIKFRELALQGMIPGVTKASW